VFSSPFLFIHILDKPLLLSYVSIVGIVRIITHIDRLVGAFATTGFPAAVETHVRPLLLTGHWDSTLRLPTDTPTSCSEKEAVLTSDVLGWASSPEPAEPGPFKPKPGPTRTRA